MAKTIKTKYSKRDLAIMFTDVMDVISEEGWDHLNMYLEDDYVEELKALYRDLSDQFEAEEKAENPDKPAPTLTFLEWGPDGELHKVEK